MHVSMHAYALNTHITTLLFGDLMWLVRGGGI